MAKQLVIHNAPLYLLDKSGQLPNELRIAFTWNGPLDRLPECIVLFGKGQEEGSPDTTFRYSLSDNFDKETRQGSFHLNTPICEKLPQSGVPGVPLKSPQFEYEMDGRRYPAAFKKFEILQHSSNSTITASRGNTSRVRNRVALKCLGTLKGHTSYVSSAIFSPDGKNILTASWDHTARIWNSATMECVGTLKGHTQSLTSASYSPDMKLIITTSRDHTARIWDSSTLECVGTLKGHTESVSSAVFSPDMNLIITTSWDQNARIWNSSTLECVGTLPGPPASFVSIMYSPNGEFILCASVLTICIWNSATFELVSTLDHNGRAQASARFSPNGKFIVSTSEDEIACIWNSSTLKRVGALRGHTADVNSAMYSPDNKYIVTASDDGTARLWNSTTLQCVSILQGHSDSVHSAIYSPDGQSVVTASSDNTACIWDTSVLAGDVEDETALVLDNAPLYIKDKNGSIPKDQRIIPFRWSGLLDQLPDYIVLSGNGIRGSFRYPFSENFDSTTGQGFFHLDCPIEPLPPSGLPLNENVPDDDKTLKFEYERAGKRHPAYFTPCQIQPADLKNYSAPRNEHQEMKHPRDLRKLAVREEPYWDSKPAPSYYNTETKVRCVKSFKAHTGPVSSVVHSPDGKLIVTTSADTTARVWNTPAIHRVATLEGHTETVTSAMFSPDSKFIVTASHDKTARVWDRLTYKCIATLEGHTDRVTSAIYSPDSRFILTVSLDGTARIWDRLTYKCVGTLGGERLEVLSAGYSPNGEFIITACADKTARIWDSSTYKCVDTLEHTDDIFSAMYSPDDKYILTASWDQTVRIWDNVRMECVGALYHTSYITSVTYSPDGKLIVTFSSDKNTRIWDSATLECVGTLRGDTDFADPAIFSPDGRFLVTPFRTNVFLWDPTPWTQASREGLRCAGTLDMHAHGVPSAMYSPNSNLIVTASWDKTARIWNSSTLECVGILEGHTRSLTSAIFSPDTSLIITTSRDNTARIWKSSTLKCVGILEGHSRDVNSAAFSPDMKLIITASLDNTARIWNSSNLKCVGTLKGSTAGLESVMYSPNGAFIICGSADRTARIWNSVTFELVGTLKGHTASVQSAMFSPDSKFIVTASWDDTARIWSSSTLECVGTLKGHTSALWSARYSPDGRYIVTASSDETARIWNTTSLEDVSILPGHSGTVYSAMFSPDGKSIVTASVDRTARIWDTSMLVSDVKEGKSLVLHTEPVYIKDKNGRISDDQRITFEWMGPPNQLPDYIVVSGNGIHGTFKYPFLKNFDRTTRQGSFHLDSPIEALPLSGLPLNDAAADDEKTLNFEYEYDGMDGRRLAADFARCQIKSTDQGTELHGKSTSGSVAASDSFDSRSDTTVLVWDISMDELLVFPKPVYIKDKNGRISDDQRITFEWMGPPNQLPDYIVVSGNGIHGTFKYPFLKNFDRANRQGSFHLDSPIEALPPSGLPLNDAAADDEKTLNFEYEYDGMDGMRRAADFARCQIKSTKEVYLKAISCYPSFSPAYTNLANELPGDVTVQLGDGRVMNKTQLYIEAIKHDPRDYIAYLELSKHLSDNETVTLADNRDMDKTQAYAEAVKHDRSGYLSHYERSKRSKRLSGDEPTEPDEKHRTNQKLYMDAITLNPQFSFAYYQLAQSISSDGRVVLSDARVMNKKELYIESIKLNPSFSAAYAKLAKELADEETVRLAEERDMNKIELYIEAIRLNSQDATFYFGLAKALSDGAKVQLPDKREMNYIQLCLEAIRWDPSLSACYVEIARKLTSDEAVKLNDGCVLKKEQLYLVALRWNPQLLSACQDLAQRLDDQGGPALNVMKIIASKVPGIAGSTFLKDRQPLFSFLDFEEALQNIDPVAPVQVRVRDTTEATDRDEQMLIATAADDKAYVWEVSPPLEGRHPNLVATLIGHVGLVNSVMFSPSKRIVTASEDTTVRIWDRITYRQLRVIYSNDGGHAAEVKSAMFSPDGQHILSASINGSVKIWSADNYNLVTTLSNCPPGLESAEYSPDGRYIVTACASPHQNNYVAIWNAHSYARLKILWLSRTVRFASFSPDTKSIVIACDQIARIWKLGHPFVENSTTEINPINQVSDVRYSPDGTRIIIACMNRTACIWDASTREYLGSLPGEPSWDYSAVYSPEGSIILTASADGQARLWNSTAFNLECTLPHNSSVVSAVFSHDWRCSYSPPTLQSE